MHKTRVDIPVSWDEPGIVVELLGKFQEKSCEAFVEHALSRQSDNSTVVAEFGEVSARLVEPTDDSPVGVYSFGIEPAGLQPHYHSGPRTITAVSGCSGVNLYFCTTPPSLVECDPQAFFANIHGISIPGDSMFFMSFRSAWHWFTPKTATHVALFAVSVHADEFYGLSEGEHQEIRTRGASIPSLTRVAPVAVIEAMASTDWAGDANKITLSW